jgi:hypothetical protein
VAKKRKSWRSNKPAQPPDLILPPDIRAALGWPPDPRWLRAADRESKKCRERFERGDKLAPFDAIALWSIFFPAWAKDAFFKAWFAYRSYEAVTLDQAFGVERPKGQHIKKAREREVLRWQILFRVYDLHHRKNAPLDAVTFASVGDELGIAGSTVAKIFGEPASDELRELVRTLHFSDYSEND